jgi:hypothetical protein
MGFQPKTPTTKAPAEWFTATPCPSPARSMSQHDTERQSRGGLSRMPRLGPSRATIAATDSWSFSVRRE